MDDRTANVIRKIRALRAKNTGRGATEHEAASAAEMAARLMAQHQIDESDIKAADYDRHLMKIKGINLHLKKSHPMVYAAGGVAHISGCRIYFSNQGIYVVGDEVGREMAHYLFDLTRNTIDAAWKTESTRRFEAAAVSYAKIFGKPLPKRATRETTAVLREFGLSRDRIAQRSFGLGMADRMARRMNEMPPARGVPEDVAKKIMSDKIEKETSAKAKPSGSYDYSAMSAGSTAGQDVAIGLGVGARGVAQRQIERK